MTLALRAIVWSAKAAVIIPLMALLLYCALPVVAILLVCVFNWR